MGTVHQLFLAYLGLMALWQGAALGISLSRSAETAVRWYGIVLLALVCQFLVYGMFVRSFLSMKVVGALIWLGIAATVPLVVFTFTNHEILFSSFSWNAETRIYTPDLSYLGLSLSVVYFAILIRSGILLYQAYRTTDSMMEQSRLRYLMAGLGAVLIGTLSNLSSFLKIYPIDVAAGILNAVLIAYAIFRYQLLDVTLVIRKGLLYSIPTITLSITYFLVISLAINLLHVSPGGQVLLLSLVLAVAAAVVAEPARNRLQGIVDRLFFRENYDSGQMLQRLSRTAATILDLDKLTEMILGDIQRTIHISTGAFLIRSAQTGDYVLTTQLGLDQAQQKALRFRSKHPIAVWLLRHQSSLPMHVIDTSPDFKGLWETERAELATLHAGLFVPLLVRNELIGILCLGEKLSEQPYAPEEQLMISTLANQTAVAIENASLFSETLAEKERTATIVEQAFAGIVLLDDQLKITGLNPAAEAIIGRDKAQVIGMPLRDVLGGSIFDEKGSLRKAMTTGERVAPREETLFTGDRRRDILLGVTPLHDGYLLSLADITQLKEVDRLKSDIVANVSHEFRTPLAIIKAYAELLMDDQQGGVAESRHEYLAIIDAETDRLAGMVGGLLDLARLEAGRDAIRMAPVRIAEIVWEAVELLEAEARARDIVVNVEVPSNLPALRGNRDLLITLVRNLLGNAIKFSYDGGGVAIVARYVNHTAVLQVIDHGLGIPEDEMTHLFEKFYRGGAARDAGIRGTGLGLVLVKQAAEAHGGTISVESQPGLGTRFSVSLPVANGGGAAQQIPELESEAWLPDPLL